MSAPEAEPPVVVRKSPSKEITEQTARVFLLGAFAFGAGFIIKSDVVLAAVVPVLAMLAGFVATYIVGIVKFLRDHRKLRFLAERADDDLAQVK
jgi:uncharacterized membrane protein